MADKFLQIFPSSHWSQWEKLVSWWYMCRTSLDLNTWTTLLNLNSNFLWSWNPRWLTCKQTWLPLPVELRAFSSYSPMKLTKSKKSQDLENFQSLARTLKLTKSRKSQDLENFKLQTKNLENSRGFGLRNFSKART